MAITLATAGRNAACAGTTAAVDAGAGAGKLKLKSAGDVVLCIITLNDPAFAAPSAGAAALDVTPALSGVGLAAAGAGTLATKFDFTDSADTVVWSGTVGVGSGEIQLDNNSIAENQTVNITGYTHTQPA
jgi:polyisoprenoid-binding protein YceI